VRNPRHGGVSLIARRIVLYLGVSQLVCWGVSYYLIGVFGDAIGSDFHWSRDVVYGGFSIALFATGLSSPLVGRWIDRRGGRDVMTIGSVAMAAGCLARPGELLWRLDRYRRRHALDALRHRFRRARAHRRPRGETPDFANYATRRVGFDNPLADRRRPCP
jgi:hypothetical protein